tara:strand:+ start:131 stop:280 length:150 start_codon:yes stop_codon:yes gene_type:complete
MTLIYKNEIEHNKKVFSTNQSNISIITNKQNNFDLKSSWFKGSRERGLR